MPVLNVDSISFSHNHDFQIQNLSFEVKPGEVLGLIGESGCGKSTVLDLVYGKYDLSKGSIAWKGQPTQGPSRQLIAGHEEINYVTQNSAELMPFISVLENIIQTLSRQHLKANHIVAQHLLEVVGLSDFKNKKVKELSGGQRQRVALAKALAKTPKLILLDEPFSHVDNFLKHNMRRQFFKYLKAINCSCIIATHDYNDVLPFADQILVLKDGQLEVNANPETLYRRSNNTYVSGLLSVSNRIEGKHVDPALKGKVKLYPHEIELVECEKEEVQIKEVYFHGRFYRIYLEWMGSEVICDSSSKPKANKCYRLHIHAKMVLDRIESAP